MRIISLRHSEYSIPYVPGNKHGLGKLRKRELYESCDVLGIREQNVFIYNCTVLPDDPKIRWREDVIAEIVLQHVEMLEIDTLITFDKHGVSRHSNHCSVYYAVAYLSMEKKIPNCTYDRLEEGGERFRSEISVGVLDSCVTNCFVFFLPYHDFRKSEIQFFVMFFCCEFSHTLCPIKIFKSTTK